MSFKVARQEIVSILGVGSLIPKCQRRGGIQNGLK